VGARDTDLLSTGKGSPRSALAGSHGRQGVSVANAGLVLASALAGRLGIEQVVDETVDLGARPGAARPGRKLLTLVFSALVGGDSIDDAGVLGSGETERVRGHRVMAPSTLGTFLRSFTLGVCAGSSAPSRRSSHEPGQLASGPGRE